VQSLIHIKTYLSSLGKYSNNGIEWCWSFLRLKFFNRYRFGIISINGQ
jgi:hypothetical protein